MLFHVMKIKFSIVLYMGIMRILIICSKIFYSNISNVKKQLEKNYIGGATFLEMYDAFRLNKKIYIPEGILYDEIQAFAPVITNGDLSKII